MPVDGTKIVQFYETCLNYQEDLVKDLANEITDGKYFRDEKDIEGDRCVTT